MSEERFSQVADLIGREMGARHVPGVAIGIAAGDQEYVAGFGVTNLEQPLPVDPDTLFQIGSITKTVTATIAMRLVEAGRLHLDAPVRTYLPNLELADPTVTAAVTMRHLLTHTAGWLGDYFDDTGAGDDALARIVARMVSLPQLTPLGRYWSYNNAAFYLAGRVLEVVGGTHYQALAEDMVLRPLGMAHSFFMAEQCITYRVAAGHLAVFGDSPAAPPVARPWAVPRSSAPVGGIVSTVRDMLRYAHFNMGDGAAPGGERLLSPGGLQGLHAPIVEAANGEHSALAWQVREVDGRRMIRHGGATHGQSASLEILPGSRFATIMLANSDRGGELFVPVQRLALRLWLGIDLKDPEPLPATAEHLAEYAGTYSAAPADIVVSLDGEALLLDVHPKGGFPTPDSPPPPAPPPVHALPCGRDRIVTVEEPDKGTQGEFLREDGAVGWLRMGGRMLRRVPQ